MIRMPAEWEPQKAVWIAWPHDMFERGYCMKLEGTYLRLVQLMKTSQIVRIIVPNQQYQEHVLQQLLFHGIGLDNVEFYIIPTNDIWIRDYGPTFVFRKRNLCDELSAQNWAFNGHGGRFSHELDRFAGGKIADAINVPLSQTWEVLEGGNIESNGAGTIMLTKSAVLNPNRNPGKSQEWLEFILEHTLGAKHIIWLSGLITEDAEKIGWSDDTDTHIDTIARFVSENRVVAPFTYDRNDPAYNLLQTTHRELIEAGLEVVRLPTVKVGFYPVTDIGAGGGINRGKDAMRTDASYANFVITNDRVIVPVYGEKEDRIAKEILREQFPGREVIGVFAGLLAENGGEFHCITQQEPVII